MWPGSLRGWYWALLCGAALTLCRVSMSAAPEAPPPGFVWEDCKAIHTRMLRPVTWFSKQGPVACYFSPDAFSETGWLEKGLTFYACPNVQADTGKTADESAAEAIANSAAKNGARRGTTKVGMPPGPFTTYTLTYAFHRPSDGKSFVMTTAYIANRETNTLYVWLLRSPSAGWPGIEPFEDVMLKSLQLDPKF